MNDSGWPGKKPVQKRGQTAPIMIHFNTMISVAQLCLMALTEKVWMD
jgi:hypothetical protein